VAASPNEVTTGTFYGVNRFAVELAYLPQPDFLEFSLPTTHCVLVTNDGTELTTTVVAALRAADQRVVVLNLPNVANPLAEQAVNLAASTDEAIGTAVQAIQTQYGKIGTFIHLHPHFEFQSGNFTQHFSADKAIVKTVFFLAKHLQKDLNELGATQRASFLTVTRLDGQLGQGQRGNTSIIGGGLPGLVKCLNLEWSPVFCRAVDLQPELPIDQITRHIVAELHDPNVTVVEVAVSADGRKTPVAKATPVPEKQKITTTVTSNSVFLVSGGARGVTATCVIEMAKTFRCKFILLGRSSFDYVVPAFAQAENDEGILKRLIMNDLKERGEQPSLAKVKSTFGDIVAKKEIDDTVAQIEGFGGQVVYVQGDVTQLAACRQELDRATAQLGKITGIMHGAGRLADKYIQDKTEKDFENVLSVKLDGLLSLLGAVKLGDLDHLILFSSVAGFYGNVGQTDYAIANEILSKAAHLFRTNHPRTQVSAINWGAWDSGMVSGELKAQFEAAGISLVNSAGGAAMLVNELSTAYANQPQVIIGGTLPAAISHLGDLRNYRIRRHLTLDNNPFLRDHVIQGNPVLPVVSGASWMAQTAASLYPDYTIFKIEDIKLFKGIIFDGSEKEAYVLELKELDKGAEQVVFEATIFSEGGKLPTNHYRARVTLVHKQQLPLAPHFTHQISGTYAPTAGATLYQDGSLFHGASFQGIGQVLDCTPTQMVLSCQAPAVSLATQGQFPVAAINAYFADIQYQGMLVWVQKNRDGANSLPLQTDSAVFYQPIPIGKKLLVHIGIVEATETQMVANCTVYDEAGTVYVVTRGAAVTISRQLVW